MFHNYWQQQKRGSMDRRGNNGYYENDTAQMARERIIEKNSKYEPKKSVKNTIENGRLKSVQQILMKSNTSKRYNGRATR